MEGNKKTTRRKIIIRIILLLIIGTIGGFFYRIGFIPVMGTQIAENKLNRYATDSLNLSQKIESKYDWYNGRYLATNDLGFSLDYRLQHNTIHDEYFGQKESELAKQDYNFFLESIPFNLTFPKDISVWTEVNADDYSIKAQRLYLLSVFNSEGLSESDSLIAPAKIAMDLISKLGDSYNFSGIQMCYADKNGMYEIIIPVDSFEPLTEEKLITHTAKISEDDYSESYLKWLAENEFL